MLASALPQELPHGEHAAAAAAFLSILRSQGEVDLEAGGRGGEAGWAREDGRIHRDF